MGEFISAFWSEMGMTFTLFGVTMSFQQIFMFGFICSILGIFIRFFMYDE